MSQKHVTLLIETSTTWGSELVHGIADYAHQEADWLIYFEPWGKYELLELPPDWDGDGVIARLTHEKLANQILASGAPAVNVSWYDFGSGQIPRCMCNERLAGEMVARHFLERGFRRFAYCGARRRPHYVDLFGTAYAATIEAAHYECIWYTDKPGEHAGAPNREEMEHLSAWLAELPKPIALLGFSDVRGRQVAEACRQARIGVPDEIAIMGGEHDWLSSQVSVPQLSSLDHSPWRVGYEAAKLLDFMMAGNQPPADPVLIPPARVIVRRSTDTLAVEDPLALQALQVIAETACQPITVKHILAKLPTSRRVLEQRFRDLLGRSPGEEIRRVRIERAKQLLAETDKSLKAIAMECGFHHAEVLTRVFRRCEDCTPTAFRQRVQGTGKPDLSRSSLQSY